MGLKASSYIEAGAEANALASAHESGPVLFEDIPGMEVGRGPALVKRRAMGTRLTRMGAHSHQCVCRLLHVRGTFVWFKVLERKKILSLTESLGILSFADKAGFNLARVHTSKSYYPYNNIMRRKSSMTTRKYAEILSCDNSPIQVSIYMDSKEYACN